MSDYQREGEYAEALEAWKKTHKNDDETFVYVVDVDGTYVGSAVDTDADGNVLASEIVATSLTPDEAIERANRWCDENPKGVKGEGAIASLLG